MKKILKTTLLSVTVATSLSALTYEHPQLYKDPKVIGMGGANVAVGGHASALFYNPAGLSFIPREYGVEVELINFSASINQNIVDFGQDFSDATDDPAVVTGDSDTDETLAMLDVVDAYMGENIHFDANNFTSVSRKGEKVGFAVGAVGGATFDARTHRGFGNDGVMEMQGLGYYGAAGGFSYDFSNVEIADKYILNDFSLGLGVKQINYMSLEHAFTISELIRDDFDTYVEDELLKEGSSTVFDVGAMYKLSENTQIGLSAINIGGIGDEDSVYIPMTVNAGIGYLKRWEDHMLFNQVRVALDYVDILYAYDQDKDVMKRTRAGVEANVWDGWFSTMTLRAGLYQGAPTYGANLRLTFLQLGYAYYQEEVGAYAGQDKDERHMVNLSLGW
ncbi:MAG: hypothetical protein QG567_1194 [Campylobacterota bacterium]|nr:hypothetical protein [Campylobacterota bacterium]